jgi:hypothetical protein
MSMETKSQQRKTGIAAASPSATVRAVAPVASAADEGSCEAWLAQVIRLAQEMGTSDAPAGDGAQPGAGGSNAAREAFGTAISNLPSDVARKLRTLMIAGREGKSINEVSVDTSLSDAQALLDAAPLGAGQSGAVLADQLRRGHALAWAAALDLERPIASWSATGQSLDERAWLSFGKQLAKSDPADWQCLGFVEPGVPGISRLYLRLDEHAWWSFQAVLDRPSAAVVAKQQRTLASRRFKGLAGRSLQSVAPQLSSSQGRALRRAARAIRARLGDVPATATATP